ncbi:hypothetical protein GQ55_9G404800 [Panicum hallii var. hallii]|uniref:Uncharacterized protein n=1 Tax=Panicum hallii var. hallii TaxID=1504633 RepID=A0A2T7CA36_9POAL|nr:hypothetical protein GQ55_9G404800 [Panicum hallii var. hallii]
MPSPSRSPRTRARFCSSPTALCLRAGSRSLPPRVSRISSSSIAPGPCPACTSPPLSSSAPPSAASTSLRGCSRTRPSSCAVPPSPACRSSCSARPSWRIGSSCSPRAPFCKSSPSPGICSDCAPALPPRTSSACNSTAYPSWRKLPWWTPRAFSGSSSGGCSSTN